MDRHHRHFHTSLWAPELNNNNISLIRSTRRRNHTTFWQGRLPRESSTVYGVNQFLNCFISFIAIQKYSAISVRNIHFNLRHRGIMGNHFVLIKRRASASNLTSRFVTRVDLRKQPELSQVTRISVPCRMENDIHRFAVNLATIRYILSVHKLQFILSDAVLRALSKWRVAPVYLVDIICFPLWREQ